MSLHHSFDINIAAQYGIAEAILIHHFQHWIMVNRRQEQNFHEGRTWTFQTLKFIASNFPYFSVKQVERLINNLVDAKVLKKGNFNKKKFDQTVWYAFENEDFFMISRFREMGIPNPGTPCPEIGKPIPDTKTESKPDTKQGNVLEPEKGPAETLPRFTKKSKRQFPLKKSQNLLFEWLASQNIDSDNDTLVYYIRVYPEQKIREAVAFMNAESNRGIQIKSRGKFLRRMLDGSVIIKSEASEENRKTAMAFVVLNDWKSAKFTEKYLRDEVTGDEVFFHLDSSQFQYQINKLHEKSMMYQ